MGISISHGVPSTRSALTISNLGTHLAHALTGTEWREVAHLFDGHLSVPVYTPPAEAGRIGELLTKAANSRAMNPEWGQLATLLAGSARRAAAARQTWEWT
ncbi:hypothetical protein SGFS_013080 [Streptomyces graminofaciens]|uniref:DUF7739 domain-containing protein n=1 Tax=Streptomyces graminofaciens TaxID=68212 RepID=A0ABM7F2N1_9ACTN|nr:hypothetical protein [Streptomyces graminofaciens]BBC30014.1 hypothetical protein SGFS_013080 [Streptomyces graminofaciens]